MQKAFPVGENIYARPNWHSIFLFGGETLTDRLAALQAAELGMIKRLANGRAQFQWARGYSLELRGIMDEWRKDLIKEYPALVYDLWDPNRPAITIENRYISQINERLERAFGALDGGGNPVLAMRGMSDRIAARASTTSKPSLSSSSLTIRMDNETFGEVRARQQELLQVRLLEHATRHF